MTTTSIHLSPNHLGVLRNGKASDEALELANRLLDTNHEKHHIFFRDLGGHNHIVHHLLTIIALGANPPQLQQAFDLNTSYQRPPPTLDENAATELQDDDKFHDRIGKPAEYSNFLAFFNQQIQAKGWQNTVKQYCFGRTRNADAVLARMYEGAYHSLIHLGLGVEFEQPTIIAEALAQAASHPSATIDSFFLDSEQQALSSQDSKPQKPIVQLLQEVRSNATIRAAPHWTDGPHKVRDGILGRARPEITSIASQFWIASPADLERRTAEMISTCAFFAGAAQRADKMPKIDFFYMHAVTSSIFFTVLTRQDWIAVEDKIRLEEWKARLDLVWYAACGAAELHSEAISEYKGDPSGDMSWSELFEAINGLNDDGHVAKFVRALKNGEEVVKPFETGSGADKAFPVQGDMWLKLARMCYDSTWNVPTDAKWIAFTGFNQPWTQQAARN